MGATRRELLSLPEPTDKQALEELRRQLNTMFPADFNDSRDIKSRAKDHDFEYLASGCYRCAFRPKHGSNLALSNPRDYVVKVSYQDDPYSNRAELDVWETLPDYICEEYLVPVVMSAESDRWILMEWADTGAGPTTDKRTERRDELKEEGYIYGDMACRNMGKHDGKFKLVDYGHTWETAEENHTDREKIVTI